MKKLVKLSIATIAFIFTFSNVSFSQTGRYDLRLVHQSFDCVKKKVTFSLEIKATSPDSEFVMGSANIPISHKNAQLKNPKIITRSNFSTFANGYKKIDSTYATSATADSSFYTVLINYVGDGTVGTTVSSTAWMPIVTFEFDVVSTNTTGCYGVSLIRQNPTTVVTRTNSTALTFEVKQGIFTNIVNQCPQNPVVSITGTAGITQGQSGTLTFTLSSGTLPATVTLSNNTVVTMTSTPQNLSVSPSTTTTYTIASVQGSCGTGTAANGANQFKITVTPTSGSGSGSNCLPICVPSSFKIIK
jgi:hypothetical protein